MSKIFGSHFQAVQAISPVGRGSPMTFGKNLLSHDRSTDGCLLLGTPLFFASAIVMWCRSEKKLQIFLTFIAIVAAGYSQLSTGDLTARGVIVFRCVKSMNPFLRALGDGREGKKRLR